MIVIFLITLITGAIGYNMRGALDRGRAFRTERAKDQLRDLLLICLAEHGDADKIAASPLKYLKDTRLAKDPENLLKDGWKVPFTISVSRDHSDFVVRSDALDKYNKKLGVADTNPESQDEN